MWRRQEEKEEEGANWLCGMAESREGMKKGNMFLQGWLSIAKGIASSSSGKHQETERERERERERENTRASSRGYSRLLADASIPQLLSPQSVI